MNNTSKKKITLLLSFLVSAIVFIGAAWYIYYRYPEKIPKIWEEIAKTLMNLGAGVIMGGLIKLLFDDYRSEQEKKDKRREFRIELLNRLRKVFDEVELSKTLIHSHKTAKTYGERLRISIMPSCIALFDIKRSLVDAETDIDRRKIAHLRVSIHYMLAYLITLVKEYKKYYLNISNQQFFEEGIREQQKKLFSERILKKLNDKDNPKSTDEIFKDDKIPDRILTTCNSIDALGQLRDFLKEGGGTKYYNLFIDHYEYCKVILRSDLNTWKANKPRAFEDSYIDYLKVLDRKKDNNELTPTDSLIDKIIEAKVL